MKDQGTGGALIKSIKNLIIFFVLQWRYFFDINYLDFLSQKKIKLLMSQFQKNKKKDFLCKIK